MADSGSASITIDANEEKVLDVINDVESLPERIDAFKQAEVLERDGEGRPKRAEFEVDARIKVIHYVLEYSYSSNSVSWKMIDGDVNEITGSYVLEPAGETTKVTYSYSIDAGFPVPGFLRKQGVKLMVDGALKDLKKTTESRA
ncbi:MAG TPA: SRPBCC family protein [Actinomycetota bacterium]|nr:SRPBCC family protein [Actinomycetota bacterium]